jgi:hypothetical protein
MIARMRFVGERRSWFSGWFRSFCSAVLMAISASIEPGGQKPVLHVLGVDMSAFALVGPGPLHLDRA